MGAHVLRVATLPCKQSVEGSIPSVSTIINGLAGLIKTELLLSIAYDSSAREYALEWLVRDLLRLNVGSLSRERLYKKR